MADICTFPCEFQPGFGKDRINRLGLAPISADKNPRCFDDYIHVLTTFHIPEPLLAEVDKRAKELELSRNGFIVDALRKALAEEPCWSPGFLDALQAFTPLDDEHDIAAISRGGTESRSRGRQ